MSEFHAEVAKAFAQDYDAMVANMRLVKVPRTAMRSWAQRQVKIEQGGLCPLCGKPIDLTIKGEGVIDHNHDTGEIRGVLHRSCNAAEGKATNAIGQWGAKSKDYPSIIAFMERLLVYLKTSGTGRMYPMHKTADEKADARAKVLKERRAAAKAKLALRSRKESA